MEKIEIKKIFLFVGAGLLVLSCAGTTKRRIFSPSSGSSKKVWNQEIHGGASLKSPPDGILISSNSDPNIHLLIFSEPIKERLTWLGLFYPFVPTFWTDYKSLSRSGEDKIAIYINSNIKEKIQPKVYLKSAGKKYCGSVVDEAIYPDSPEAWMGSILNEDNKKDHLKLHLNSFYKIEFDIKNDELSEYDLEIDGFEVNNVDIKFNEIHFNKAWQLHKFIGP
jgi:hypothetical protein